MIGSPCRTVKVALQLAVHSLAHFMRTPEALAVSLYRGTLLELAQQM